MIDQAQNSSDSPFDKQQTLESPQRSPNSIPSFPEVTVNNFSMSKDNQSIFLLLTLSHNLNRKKTLFIIPVPF